MIFSPSIIKRSFCRLLKDVGNRVRKAIYLAKSKLLVGNGHELFNSKISWAHELLDEEEGIILPILRKEIFFKMCGKLETYKLAEETGVEYPIKFLPESKSELSEITKEMRFPVVGKPPGLSGARVIVYA